ncbi:galactose-1-phosphate uridylyltransferase [Persicimonas caeni]|uniref:Galactose-1-phosphate uridylyltransferase n=1 Tax=Persicimonas caeni TaxID=2292766 RepID=A0A4Y6PN42_PERCE|nr:galactose-1-phosphate uridylyltransferase [Persicimonas caeni]QDG49728.1 galactose-1-phosphate uridylyltransferase [Persicimonas caeni]QED30949.1 galactose-1-phosphate uridylyltransferase [Persicimonas caeni]
MPMLRKDPIAGRWVIIATERAKRPREYQVDTESLPSGFCPFCAGNEDSTPDPVAIYPKGADQDWSVRVIPNKFPALQTTGELTPHTEGVYEGLAGVGAHEVIIEAAEHVSDLAALPVDQIATVLRAWKDRINDLRNDERLECAVVFKNHGAAAGASLEHTHSQLIALPIIPKRLSEELVGSKRYYLAHDRCVYCDIVAQELDEGTRVVCSDDKVVALTPFASRFPFELWILPREHDPWYENSDDELFASVAAVLKRVLQKLNRALDSPPFNLMLHSAPFPDGDDVSHYHWHLELIPKLTKVAGFEWGTGFYINPTSPESAAEHLREIEID